MISDQLKLTNTFIKLSIIPNQPLFYIPRINCIHTYLYTTPQLISWTRALLFINRLMVVAGRVHLRSGLAGWLLLITVTTPNIWSILICGNGRGHKYRCPSRNSHKRLPIVVGRGGASCAVLLSCEWPYPSSAAAAAVCPSCVWCDISWWREFSLKIITHVNQSSHPCEEKNNSWPKCTTKCIHITKESSNKSQHNNETAARKCKSVRLVPRPVADRGHLGVYSRSVHISPGHG